MLAWGGFCAPRVSLATVLLFLISAISMTALPMPARILFERGSTNTRMGPLNGPQLPHPGRRCRPCSPH